MKTQRSRTTYLGASMVITVIVGAWTPIRPPLAVQTQPPWLLIAVLLAGGCLGAVGAEVLLARRWRGRAHAAEQERDRATERLQTATRTFVEQIEGLRQVVLGAYSADPPEVGDGSDGFAERDRSRFETTVNSVFSMARRATTAAGDTPSLWDQVRAILVRRLGRANVDEITLADAGGTDPGIRQHIARDISRQWPNLAPVWTADDVMPDSTLASLVNEIDGRMP